ncbi:MAG: CHASE2 domain-containing protein [Pseudomonadota bacterium]|nr:CHASE2 domain-containing protein [Pseudomonadota bacterium]
MPLLPTNPWKALRSDFQLFLLGIVVTSLFSLLYIFEPPFFRFLELRFYDTILRENPSGRPATDVLIVDIDEGSLKEFGQWPWPRYLVARLLKAIQERGPSAIGVDMLFAEEDRTSLDVVLRRIRKTYGVAPPMENMPPVGMNNDRLLSETLRNGPFVLARKFLFDDGMASSEECVLHPIPLAILGARGADPKDMPFHPASGVVCNLPMFDAAVAASGFINAPFDIDGLVRRIPLIIRYNPGHREPAFFPSLALATVMKRKNIRQASVRMSAGKPSEILLGDVVIPVDGIGNMLIRYLDKERAFPYISAADLLAGRLPEASMKGKIVFVGASATGLGEKRTTPVHPFLPGVEIHATVAQNILQSHFVRRPSWISGLEFFFILFAGLLTTILFIRTHAKWSLLLLLALSIGLWSVSCWSFRGEGIILSPLIPLLTVATIFSLSSLLKFWKSERELRRSESQYRSIFDNAIEGICQITPEGGIVAANPAFARIMGYDSTTDMFAAITHIQSLRFKNPDTPAYLFGVLADNGVIRAFETEIYTGKGNKVWVSINASATRSKENLPLYEASIEDISDRKRSEEALKESRQRLADIIDFLPDATLVIDRDGRVIAWNRAMETLTGVRKEEMLGKGDMEYALPLHGERRPLLIDLALHPDPEIERQYAAVRQAGDLLFGEAHALALSHDDVHLSSLASVLRNSQGEVIGAIECLRNDTERKRLEERLARAEKMEALGAMAGGVAHDLNNVLGVLVGYSELMLLKIPEGDPLRRYAANILQSGERGAAIIQDLLTLARRGVTVADVVNLNHVLSAYFETPDFAKLRDDHPQVAFIKDLGDDLMNIKGSSVHLSKTVMNLVVNAAEAMAGPGEVVVKTENCYLDVPIRGYDDVKEGDYVVLSVSDTGQGIAPRDLEKIFEPFYTKKTMGKSGTGLGLAVVWGTVKDHAGYIDVRSQEGAGSVFTLYFPATREGLPEDKPRASIEQYLGAGETILVVDDMEGQRELAVSMLTRLNYRAVAVSSGEEAVSYLASHPADLMLLDMIMAPGMDGLETYRRVMAINPHQKAVIISGYTETERVREVQALGAGGFVRKPYALENLGLAIQKELSKAS